MLELKTQGLFFPLTYKIDQKTIFSVNGNKINETETEITWNIEQMDNFDDELVVQIKTGVHKVIKYNNQYRQLLEFMSLFNIPISNLVLVLNKSGAPVKVKNQADIYECWKTLRHDKLSQYENDETIKPIIDGADSDFSNTITLIRKSPLYFLFFHNIYGESNLTAPSLFTAPSQLFTGKEVNFEASKEVMSDDNKYTGITMSAEGLPNGDFKKVYNASFKNIFPESNFHYESKLKAVYSYDSEHGIIDTCHAEIAETLSKNKLCSQQVFDIKFIKEEIKVWRNY